MFRRPAIGGDCAIDATGPGERPGTIEPAAHGLRTPLRVGQTFLDGGCETFRVVGIDVASRVPAHFGKAGAPGDDDGDAAGHRLERGQAEAFVDRRIEEQAGAGVDQIQS